MQLAHRHPGLPLESVVAADTSVTEHVSASIHRKHPRPKQYQTPRLSDGLHH
jgi:hypothetical protein